MVEIEQYDLLILGGGKSGKTLAMDQARQGRRVAMIEAGMIGGSCINVACIPSKALIRSAEMLHSAREASAFGVVGGAVLADMPAVARRTADVVAGMVDLNHRAFDASGLDLILGWGRFVAPRVIEVSTTDGVRRFSSEAIYLNLGTRASLPDVPGMADAEPMTHVEALRLTVLPTVLLVLGGGYVGIEMAQAFRRLGSEVVLLEAGAEVASREDPDVAEEIVSILQDAGVQLVTDARVTHVNGRSGEAVSVRTADGRTFNGSHLLVATGRKPRTADIGLDIAGVDLTAAGFVAVDDTLRTTASGVWAMGEAAGTPMFTHAALDDFRVVKSNLEGNARSTRDRIIPSCLFIDPEYARVGLTEREAAARGIAVRVARLPMNLVPRARTMSVERGFMKCLVSVHDDAILGFTMIGENAGDVMTVVQIAMLGKLPYPMLRDAIVAHPTIAEGLNLLFAKL